MVAIPYKVYVVVDREFGELLAAIEPGAPVWIVDTPTNKAVAKRLWTERPQENHSTGITTFDTDESSSPEDVLLDELDTIDLRHGAYSADPPYTVLEVIGAPLSATIETAMSAYGFNEFETNSTGFTAKRPAPSNQAAPLAVDLS